MLDAVGTGLHPSVVAFEMAGKCDVSRLSFESFQVGGLRGLKESCNLRGVAERGCGF